MSSMTANTAVRKLHVVDSHTAGEPTRIILDGGPDLGSGPLTARRELFRREFDEIRSAAVNEPRGSDAMVGGLLCAPIEVGSTAGVIFFNNVGYLGMCGHGTIGLLATLEYLGRAAVGRHRIETPVGTVEATLHGAGRVTVENVESYRSAKDVAVKIEGHRTVHGDVAWGGNWFFLVRDHGEKLVLANVDRLTRLTLQIRDALTKAGIRGDDGGEIDHVELFGPPTLPDADSRNFVLCPGGAYDRSPCGTGTSAKLACLAADGLLEPGRVYRQESIIGSVFEGQYDRAGARIRPSITGSAFVTAEATLLLDDRDPFQLGIRG
jgi:4-hydroxyproline epimerase